MTHAPKGYPPAHTAQATPGGDKPKQRLVGVDVARGLALLGMMTVHILPAVTVDGEPTVTWMTFSGIAAALFALLAGLTLAFVSGGSRPLRGRALTASRMSLVVRAALIAAIGLLIAYADPPAAIILVYYGVMFLLAIPLLRLPVWALVATAVGTAVLGPVAVHPLRGSLPDLSGYDPTFTTLVTQPIAFVSVVLFTGSFPVIPWIAYVCAGLAIGRLDLRAKATAIRLFITGALVAGGAWLISYILQGPLGGRARLQEATPWSATEFEQYLTWGPPPELPATTWWWLTVLSPYTGTPFEVLHSLGIAVAALGAVLLLGRWAGSVLQPFAAAGSMSLTLYSTHLLVLATGFLENVPWISFLFQVLVAIVFAVVWRHRMGPGPLERMISTAARTVRHRVERGPG